MRIRMRQHVTRCPFGGIHVRRWMAYRENGALHIERGADPNCDQCHGTGARVTVNPAHPDDPDFDICPCTDGPRLRIRYRPQPAADPQFCDEPPF